MYFPNILILRPQSFGLLHYYYSPKTVIFFLRKKSDLFCLKKMEAILFMKIFRWNCSKFCEDSPACWWKGIWLRALFHSYFVNWSWKNIHCWHWDVRSNYELWETIHFRKNIYMLMALRLQPFECLISMLKVKLFYLRSSSSFNDARFNCFN